MGVRSNTLALLWELQISTQHCSVSHHHTSYMVLVQNSVSHCIIFVVTYPERLTEPILKSPSSWRRALLLGQEEKRTMQYSVIFRKKKAIFRPYHSAFPDRIRAGRWEHEVPLWSVLCL